MSSIRVKDLSKRYRIGTGLIRLRDMFSINRNRKNEKYHWALRDVNFELQPGEVSRHHWP